MFKLRIETKNAAFEFSPEVEVQRILSEVSNKLDSGDSGTIHDINGNRVGEWTLTKKGEGR